MNLQDVIDFAEGAYECLEGAPWRWADLAMTKPYQLVTVGMDEGTADIEHRLAAAMIHHLQCLKDKSGIKRPVLYWRWKHKVRREDNYLHARIYIDGNPGRPAGNPSKPWGTPGVGQVRMVA